MVLPAKKSPNVVAQVASALRPFLHLFDNVVDCHNCEVGRGADLDIPPERGVTLVWHFPEFLRDFGPWRKGDKVYQLTLHLDTWQLVETNLQDLLIRECTVTPHLSILGPCFEAK